jgi:hypothetical protein
MEKSARESINSMEQRKAGSVMQINDLLTKDVPFTAQKVQKEIKKWKLKR